MSETNNRVWLTEMVDQFLEAVRQTDLASCQTPRGRRPEKNRSIVFYHQQQIWYVARRLARPVPM